MYIYVPVWKQTLEVSEGILEYIYLDVPHISKLSLSEYGKHRCSQIVKSFSDTYRNEDWKLSSERIPFTLHLTSRFPAGATNAACFLKLFQLFWIWSNLVHISCICVTQRCSKSQTSCYISKLGETPDESLSLLFHTLWYFGAVPGSVLGDWLWGHIWVSACGVCAQLWVLSLAQ